VPIDGVEVEYEHRLHVARLESGGGEHLFQSGRGIVTVDFPLQRVAAVARLHLLVVHPYGELRGRQIREDDAALGAVARPLTKQTAPVGRAA